MRNIYFPSHPSSRPGPLQSCKLSMNMQSDRIIFSTSSSSSRNMVLKRRIAIPKIGRTPNLLRRVRVTDDVRTVPTTQLYPEKTAIITAIKKKTQLQD